MAAISASLVAPVAPRAVAFKPTTKTSAKAVFVSNGTVAKTTAMQVWTPINNKFFETFSFLPALSNDEITKQVDYIVRNGWTPCLEFSDAEFAYTDSANTNRFSNGASVCYYDNRYWSMWKLPMFGCTDGSQVLKEISGCTKAFPNAYIRLVAFDNVKQVQCAGFLVHRPPNATEYAAPNKRSL